MTESRIYDLIGMRRTAVDFTLMAVAAFAVQIERMLADYALAEFAYMIVLIICWMGAMFGTRGIVKYRPEFGQAYRVTMIAVVCVVVAGGLAFADWYRGDGTQAFLSAGVMFMMFTQMMAQLYVYSKALNGGGELLKKGGYPRKRNVCRVIWKPCVLIILLAQFAIPAAKLFEGQTVYIIAGTAAALALIANFMMIRMMMNVYDLLHGRTTRKRPPRQGQVRKSAEPKPQQAPKKKQAPRPQAGPKGGSVKVKS